MGRSGGSPAEHALHSGDFVVSNPLKTLSFVSNYIDSRVISSLQDERSQQGSDLLETTFIANTTCPYCTYFNGGIFRTNGLFP